MVYRVPRPGAQPAVPRQIPCHPTVGADRRVRPERGPIEGSPSEKMGRRPFRAGATLTKKRNSPLI